MKLKRSKKHTMKGILVLFLLSLEEIKGNGKQINFEHARSYLTSTIWHDTFEETLPQFEESYMPLRISRGGSISTGDANEQIDSPVTQNTNINQPEMRQDIFVDPLDIHATKRDGSRQLMDRSKV